MPVGAKTVNSARIGIRGFIRHYLVGLHVELVGDKNFINFNTIKVSHVDNVFGLYLIVSR